MVSKWTKLEYQEEIEYQAFVAFNMVIVSDSALHAAPALMVVSKSR